MALSEAQAEHRCSAQEDALDMDRRSVVEKAADPTSQRSRAAGEDSWTVGSGPSSSRTVDPSRKDANRVSTRRRLPVTKSEAWRRLGYACSGPIVALTQMLETRSPRTNAVLLIACWAVSQ